MDQSNAIPTPPVPDSVQFVAALPLDVQQRDALLLDMHGKVAAIEAKIEMLPDHEERLRKVERRQWGIPGSLLVALLAALGFPHIPS